MLRPDDDQGMLLAVLAPLLRSALGDHEQAEALTIELLNLADASADDGRLSVAHLVRGIERLGQGDQPGARSCFEDALAMARATDDPTLLAMCLEAVGDDHGPLYR